MSNFKRFKKAGVLIVCLSLMSLSLSACGKKEVLPADNKEEVILTIDDREITLGDLAYYIYSVEQLVQQQAYVYDKDDPTLYWKLYTNGKFLKLLAKDMCLERAERDFILAAEADNKGIKLSEEQTEGARDFAEETFSDIDSTIINRLGLTQDMLTETILRAQLAEYYAKTIVEEESLAEDDLKVGGSYYNALKDKHNIEVKEDEWEEVEFGKITVNFE